MSVTEQQRAYHLRKMRTRMHKIDLNKDGYISREDFELMAKGFVENTSGITKERSEQIYAQFSNIADAINLKPGVKIPLEEIAKITSDRYLSNNVIKNPEEVHQMVFDCIDTNNDGHISVEEFNTYYTILQNDITEDEMKHCFDLIDSDGNGEISREEFVAASIEFYFGVEETELSNVFYGKLLP